MRRFSIGFVAASLIATLVSIVPANASEFVRPWVNKDRALIIDAYAHNEFDLTKIVEDERVAAFIHKASDGLPPNYRCTGDETERQLCRQTWQRYVIAKQLYETRRALAKALGLKWGAYHLGRPGDPIHQAQHFLKYADPADDDVMVIDIEDNDPEKWMSLSDAERFARYVKSKTNRWPILYTNGSTAQYIADHRADYPVLSRLPLWYARYKPSIAGHFPKGNWDTYQIWQFVAQINCGKKHCPYRVPGTNTDIDVNVVDMDVEALKAAWPFDELLKAKPLPDNPRRAPAPKKSVPMLTVEIGDETFKMPLPSFAQRGPAKATVLASHADKASGRHAAQASNPRSRALHHPELDTIKTAATTPPPLTVYVP